jgi:hypothetical protein
LTDERAKRDAYAVGKQDLAALVEAVDGQALQVIGVVRALWRDDADPRVKPGGDRATR